jgi:hypothetical protein
MKSFGTELGLSPSARTRIKVPDGQTELSFGQPESPFARTQRLASSQ